MSSPSGVEAASQWRAQRGDLEWGERAFQVRDPNGVIVQLVDWNGPGGHPTTGNVH
nr:hypothetical protein [Parafrankia elaeagni]